MDNTGEPERVQEAGGTPAHGSRFNYYQKWLEKKENPSWAQGWEGLSRTAGRSACSFPWAQELVWRGGKGGQALLSVSHCRFCTQLQVAEKHRQKKIIIIK